MKNNSKFVFLIIFSLILSSCATWLQGKVNMNINTNSASLADLFREETKLESLDRPQQVYASEALYPNKIVLSWTEVENATSYIVERAIVKTKDTNGQYLMPDESDFSVINKYVLKNSFTDNILTSPSSTSEEYNFHYFYRIYAENKEEGIISEPSDINNSETRGEGWLLACPTNVEAEKGKSTTKITVTWNPVKEAVRYSIYRGETPTSLEIIATVYGNTCFYENQISVLEQGKEFYYKVAAINHTQNQSCLSSEAIGYSLAEGAPGIAGNVRVIEGKATSISQLEIAWDEVGKTSETAIMTYNLYRTSSQDSVYTRVKGDLTATTFTDTSVKPGLIYYYYVQSVSTDEGVITKGAFSETSETSYGYLLSPPSQIEIADGSDSETVLVVWEGSVGWEEVPLKYNIYISSEKDGQYQILESQISANLNSDGYYEYETGKNPFFKISAVNENSPYDTESSLSVAASPIPDAPQNVTASKTSYMTETLTPNSNNVYPVKITWEKPVSDNPAGYNIYRSAKPDSSFRKINENPVTECLFIDDGIENITKSGVVYYYKVVSINSLGQGKKSNNPKLEYDEAAQSGEGLKAINSLGYGALTRDQWFREYNKTAINSQTKLTLMHKPNDTDKLGKETVKGTISGTLSYNAVIDGLGAKITMPYTDYADFYACGDEVLGVYFLLNGNTNTSSNMSGNGSMNGNVICKGMYPGTAGYNNLGIRGGAAGAGYYDVETRDLDGNIILVNSNGNSELYVDWLVGEEGRK